MSFYDYFVYSRDRRTSLFEELNLVYLNGSLFICPSFVCLSHSRKGDNYLNQILGKVSIKDHRSAIENVNWGLFESSELDKAIGLIMPRWDARDRHTWVILEDANTYIYKSTTNQRTEKRQYNCWPKSTLSRGRHPKKFAEKLDNRIILITGSCQIENRNNFRSCYTKKTQIEFGYLSVPCGGTSSTRNKFSKDAPGHKFEND